MRPPALALAAGLAAWALLAGGEAGFVLQFVLGKLAYSTSNGAALFLLAWGTLAVACWRLRLGHARAVPVFVAALALGHALHLGLALGYFAETQVPLALHAYHWRDGAYSFTALFHSHLGKTGFAWASAGWAPAGYDGGTVFLARVPAWAAATLGACFVVAFAAGLLALRPAARRDGSQRTALFALAAAIALRGLLDGGPLAAAMPPAFAALAWVLGPRTRRAALAIFAALGLYLALWIGTAESLPGLGGFLFPALLLLWLARPAARLARRALPLLLAAMLALDAAENLWPLLLAQGPACAAWSLAADGARRESCAGESPWQAYLHLGEDPRKPRRTLLGTSDAAGDREVVIDVLPLEARTEATGNARSAAWLRIVQLPPPRAGWQSFRAEARTELPPVLPSGWPGAMARNNFNVYLWEFARVLEAGGLREFVLVPRTRGNAAEP